MVVSAWCRHMQSSMGTDTPVLYISLWAQRAAAQVVTVQKIWFVLHTCSAARLTEYVVCFTRLVSPNKKT